MNRRSFARKLALLAGSVGATAAWRGTWSGISMQPRLSEFNVRDFGALGNGITDDAPAFSEALLAAAASGGIVAVPAGRYLVTRTLRVGSGVTLQGSGPGSVVLSNGSTPVVFSVTDANMVVFRGLAVTGVFSYGVIIDRSVGVTIASCEVRGATVTRGGQASGVLIAASQDIAIEDCVFEKNGGEGAFLYSDIQCDGDGKQSTDVRISRNRCESTRVTTNIACYAAVRCSVVFNRISGARLRAPENGGYGVMLYETPALADLCADNLVIGNEVSDTEGSGIYLNRSHRTKVYNNRVARVARLQADGVLPVGGVSVNHCRAVEVSGNRISDVRHAGIIVASDRAGVGPVTIENNTVSRCGGPGVQLRGLLAEITVRDNVIGSTAGGVGDAAGSHQDGITLTGNTLSNLTGEAAGIALSGASRARIDGNFVDGCGGYGIDVIVSDDQSIVDHNEVLRSGTSASGAALAVRVVRAGQRP